MNNVNRYKWEEGQRLEKEYHDLQNYELLSGYEHHRKFYAGYFEYLGIDKNVNGRKILEIGPANFPLLGYCSLTEKCSVLEPMESEFLDFICELKGVNIIYELAEEIEFPKVDEIWLCNVLQHVINPDVIIGKCKEAADIVRFFEPIDTGIDLMHHWTLTLDYFKEKFGEATLYPENSEEPDFHKWRCAYGVWTK